MTPEDRRRLGALSALVAGVFVALCLLPQVPTGFVGRSLGGALWRYLGAGAVGLPVLGVALALAGFDRLPRLDMKRTAILVGGLSLLVPFTAGILTGAAPVSFDPPLADWSFAARATGLLPGLVAFGVLGLVGKTGGLLLAFLATSALTILTLAWHPLRRLEKVPVEAAALPAAPAARRARAPRAVPVAAGSVDDEDEDEEEEEDEAPAARAPKPPRAKPAKPAKPAAQKPVAAPPAQPTGAEDELPPVELLQVPPPQDVAADQAELDRLGQSLIETLRTFKVDGSIAGWTSGPVVTQFEVAPGPGVKAGRIISLADDLAITMRATSIRVAPIPGKGAVGVEVPNPTARMVTLREMIESAEWTRSRAMLPVALGRDLEGKPVVTDLAKMPHLLIAGATGTGKSVGINAIISCLVYKYTAERLRFLMIDPKMVELSMYNELPHLRHKVVTNNNDAARVLKWAVYEMNRRYELLHANGSRNIADFNRKVEDGKPLRNPAPEPVTLKDIAAQETTTAPEPAKPETYTEGILPYIVIVVDELADLMMTVAAEVETPLAMLAQKARAIGIHLILATQRPSVNVLTGLIKANFPSRIGFRVASKVDSRTILDQNGAEALLGNGDMLFLPPGRSEPMRIQGAFIGTEETEGVMEWFRARRKAREAAQLVDRSEDDIIALVRAQEAEEGGGPEGDVDGERDTLFREAAEACIQNQGGSTSLLQRKLRIGYGRAARIIDQLHAVGILGPPDGSKPREVLIGFDQLDEYLS
ncbi:MAG: DNA translocase FtsK [Gemmatimonadales bacterium]